MPTCPSGHDSPTTDYCDTCGAVMGPVAAPSAAAEPALTCPACGAPRAGRFCEECGQDAAAPVLAPTPGPSTPPAATHSVPPVTPEWIAVVTADGSWFERMRQRNGPDAESLEFPPYCPPRRFVLAGEQLRIGRRSRSRGIDPEIDLSGPPLDPGVSALHALLVAQPDGGWSVVDLDSTNGTTVNDAAREIPPNIPVALADGDRIHLGAWTTITITTSS